MKNQLGGQGFCISGHPYSVKTENVLLGTGLSAVENQELF